MNKSFPTALALAFCSFFAIAPDLAHAEIKVGLMNEPVPPLFWKDASGQWTGFSYELMNAVCAEIKEKCTIVETSWDGLIPALGAKKFDMIWSDMSITDERKKILDFSDPYQKGRQRMVGQKDGKPGSTADDISGKTVGVQVATVQERYFKKHYAGKANAKVYQSLDQSLEDLASGRVDYVFGGNPAMTAFLKSERGQACCEDKGLIEPDDAIFGYGVGAGFRKGDDELRQKINKGLAGVLASGDYHKIAKKYFDFDPYDVK